MMISERVWITIGFTSYLLTIDESEWRVYGNSLYLLFLQLFYKLKIISK